MRHSETGARDTFFWLTYHQEDMNNTYHTEAGSQKRAAHARTAAWLTLFYMGCAREINNCLKRVAP